MEYKDLKLVLQHMESPFGFIKGFQMEQKVKVEVDKKHEELEERKEEIMSSGWELPPHLQERMEKLEVREKEVEKKVDLIAERVAQRLGYDDVPWLKLTWYLLWIYSALTNLVMLKREDFLDLAICVIAFYMLLNKDRINRAIFRILVAGIILSLIYDIFWFIIKHSEFSSSSAEDAGTELKVKQFVLIVSYILFIVKVNITCAYFIASCSDCVLEGFHGLRQDLSG